MNGLGREVDYLQGKDDLVRPHRNRASPKLYGSIVETTLGTQPEHFKDIGKISYSVYVVSNN